MRFFPGAIHRKIDVKLIEARDRHFAWMLGKIKTMPGLKLPPGGVDIPETLILLRNLTSQLRKEGCRASWMVVSGREVIGLCSYTQLPDAYGDVRFGYGIAASRRCRGYGRAAVAAVIEKTRRDPAVRRLVAETATNNIPSHRILECNGFVRVGSRLDPEDGVLIVWQRDVADRETAVA